MIDRARESADESKETLRFSGFFSTLPLIRDLPPIRSALFWRREQHVSSSANDWVDTASVPRDQRTKLHFSHGVYAR